MRKIVAVFAASVDGYIAGPNDEYDWILYDEKIDFAEEMKRFDAFFYGRRSYELALDWFGKSPKGIANYVFSNTLTETQNNFVLISGDAEKQVRALKQEDGKDIAIFGGGLLASLLDLHLVDEISVSFIPVLLGSGKPMVAFLKNNVRLQFLFSRRYQNGTITVSYAVMYE